MRRKKRKIKNRKRLVVVVTKMGKFEKYKGEISFMVGEEKFDLKFLIRDRINLSAVYDHKDLKSRTEALINYCTDIIQRSYSAESKEEIESFLTNNIDDFLTKFMVASGIVTEADLKNLKDKAMGAASKKVSLQ